MTALLAEDPGDLQGSAAVFLSRHAPQTTQAIETALIETLKIAGNPKLRADAATEIGKHRISAGIPRLVDDLEDAPSEVLTASLTALRDFGPQADAAVPQLLEMFKASPDNQDQIAEVLEKICPASKTASVELAKALGDENTELRQQAVALLEQADYIASAAPTLVAALKDQDPQVRMMAAKLLSKIGGHAEQVVPVLVETLGEEELDWEVSSLLQQSWRRSVPELIKRVTAEDTALLVRVRAAQILGGMSTILGQDGQTELEAALESPQVEIKGCAAIAISGYGSQNPKRLSALLEGLKTEGPEFRKACLGSLNGNTKREAPEVSATLIDLLEDPDETIQQAAAYSLPVWKLSDADFNRLLELLNKDESRGMALAALTDRKDLPQPFLKRLAEIVKTSEEEDEARSAVDLLSLAGKSGGELLVEILADTDLEMSRRTSAVRLAGRLARMDKDVVPLLEVLLAKDDPQLKVMAAIALAGPQPDPKPLLPFLITGIQSEDREIKYGARRGARAHRRPVSLNVSNCA